MTYQAIFAAAAIAMSGSSAIAGELPTYEVDGIVMTRHQQSVLIPSNAQERTPAFVFAYGSPHQIMVLTPRLHSTIAASGGSGTQPPSDLLIKVSQ